MLPHLEQNSLRLEQVSQSLAPGGMVVGEYDASAFDGNGSEVLRLTGSYRLCYAYDYSDTTDLMQVRITHPSGLSEIQHATAERDRVIQALDACAGNQTRAAKLLGVSRRTLVKRLDEYNLPRPKKR